MDVVKGAMKRRTNRRCSVMRERATEQKNETRETDARRAEQRRCDAIKKGNEAKLIRSTRGGLRAAGKTEGERDEKGDENEANEREGMKHEGETRRENEKQARKHQPTNNNSTPTTPTATQDPAPSASPASRPES